jgi:hypothetical protein
MPGLRLIKRDQDGQFARVNTLVPGSKEAKEAAARAAKARQRISLGGGRRGGDAKAAKAKRGKGGIAAGSLPLKEAGKIAEKFNLGRDNKSPENKAAYREASKVARELKRDNPNGNTPTADRIYSTAKRLKLLSEEIDGNVAAAKLKLQKDPEVRKKLLSELSPDELAASPEAKMVKDYLEANPGQHDPSEISKATKIPTRDIFNIGRELASRGDLSQTGTPSRHKFGSAKDPSTPTPARTKAAQRRGETQHQEEQRKAREREVKNAKLNAQSGAIRETAYNGRQDSIQVGDVLKLGKSGTRWRVEEITTNGGKKEKRLKSLDSATTKPFNEYEAGRVSFHDKSGRAAVAEKKVEDRKASEAKVPKEIAEPSEERLSRERIVADEFNNWWAGVSDSFGQEDGGEADISIARDFFAEHLNDHPDRMGYEEIHDPQIEKDLKVFDDLTSEVNNKARARKSFEAWLSDPNTLDQFAKNGKYNTEGTEYDLTDLIDFWAESRSDNANIGIVEGKGAPSFEKIRDEIVKEAKAEGVKLGSAPEAPKAKPQTAAEKAKLKSAALDKIRDANNAFDADPGKNGPNSPAQKDIEAALAEYRRLDEELQAMEPDRSVELPKHPQNTAEVVDVMQNRHPQVRLEGFAENVEKAREQTLAEWEAKGIARYRAENLVASSTTAASASRSFLSGLDGQMVKYPGINVTDVAAERLGNITNASGSGQIGAQCGCSGHNFVRISVNSEQITDVARVVRNAREARGTSAKHHFPGYDRAPLRYNAIHEFGHAVDHFANRDVDGTPKSTEERQRIAALTHIEVAGVLTQAHRDSGSSETMSNWLLENMSGYSINNERADVDDYLLPDVNVVEALAEAWVDGEMNGEKASPTSKALHRYMQTKLKENGRYDGDITFEQKSDAVVTKDPTTGIESTSTTLNPPSRTKIDIYKESLQSESMANLKARLKMFQPIPSQPVRDEDRERFTAVRNEIDRRTVRKRPKINRNSATQRDINAGRGPEQTTSGKTDLAYVNRFQLKESELRALARAVAGNREQEFGKDLNSVWEPGPGGSGRMQNPSKKPSTVAERKEAMESAISGIGYYIEEEISDYGPEDEYDNDAAMEASPERKRLNQLALYISGDTTVDIGKASINELVAEQKRAPANSVALRAIHEEFDRRGLSHKRSDHKGGTAYNSSSRANGKAR